MPVQIVSEHIANALPGSDNSASLEMLVAESNHRIANNLSLVAGILRLQVNELTRSGRVLEPEQVGQLLAEVGARIETVGRLHRLLAQSAGASHMELGSYLQDIAQAAIQSMSGSNVTLKPMSGDHCEIPAQIALSVGFVVGEAVTNSVKYAHPCAVRGTIALHCARGGDGSTHIQVVDDGVGLPEGFDPRTDGGLGLRMMRTIAGQLGAKLTFDASGIGLAVDLRLAPNRPVSAN
ncbi:MAG TPA: sensor histidine kinase [Caulobacteraceae bacterium]|nr:sensor histidine kinase [Caulobacteraceae bacterium]